MPQSFAETEVDSFCLERVRLSKAGHAFCVSCPCSCTVPRHGRCSIQGRCLVVYKLHAQRARDVPVPSGTEYEGERPYMPGGHRAQDKAKEPCSIRARKECQIRLSLSRLTTIRTSPVPSCSLVPPRCLSSNSAAKHCLGY